MELGSLCQNDISTLVVIIHDPDRCIPVPVLIVIMIFILDARHVDGDHLARVNRRCIGLGIPHRQTTNRNDQPGKASYVGAARGVRTVAETFVEHFG